MKRIASLPLRRYFTRQLIILGVLLSALYGYAMFTLYNWGLDDASEHYMYLDAEQAETRLIEGRALPVNTHFRQFYLDRKKLPEKYQSLFESGSRREAIKTLETENSFDYVLAYPLPADVIDDKAHTLFIIHIFDLEEDDTLPGWSVRDLFLVLLALAICFTLLLALLLSRKIELAFLTLSRWADTLEWQNSKALLAPPPEKIHFAEMRVVSDKLHAAFNRILSLTEREKSFVRCLSHELRTPMAVVRAALDLLEKRELTEFAKHKINKIREANTKMIGISDTLLRVWLEQDRVEKPASFDLHALIEEILADQITVPTRPEVNVSNHLPVGLMVFLPRQMCFILLSNLVKNALQYTHEGFVSIEGDAGGVSITNTLSASGLNSKSVHDDYGFGLGLFIAETIAQRLGWPLRFGKEEGVFKCALCFARRAS